MNSIKEYWTFNYCCHCFKQPWKFVVPMLFMSSLTRIKPQMHFQFCNETSNALPKTSVRQWTYFTPQRLSWLQLNHIKTIRSFWSRHDIIWHVMSNTILGWEKIPLCRGKLIDKWSRLFCFYLMYSFKYMQESCKDMNAHVNTWRLHDWMTWMNDMT